MLTFHYAVQEYVLDGDYVLRTYIKNMFCKNMLFKNMSLQMEIGFAYALLDIGTNSGLD